MNVYLWALLGTGFPFLMTAAGSALVFLFKKPAGGHLQKAFLGFAAGVMVAASVWSLLIPAIEDSEAMGLPGWPPSDLSPADCFCFFWTGCCRICIWMRRRRRDCRRTGKRPR